MDGASRRVQDWIQRKYPKPRVDPEWLSACLNWIHTDLNIPLPNSSAPLSQALLNALDDQLLRSDLTDSMLPETGLPLDVAELNDLALKGPHVLVEIIAITEVGSSAFQLMQVKAAREERGVVGLDGGEGDDVEEEEEGPIQKYPRGMLRFELSDGHTTLQAIEYRSIPQLQLGVTPLGYKLLLKNPFIRRGIAFLEPACIELKGGLTEDREGNQMRDFTRGLRVRLGQPMIDDEGDADQNQNLPPPPAPPQPPAHLPNPHLNSRAPFREISSPPLPSHTDLHADDEASPRRRKVPNPNPNTVPRSPGPGSSTGRGPPSTSSTSNYFPSASALPGNSNTSRTGQILSRERILSPLTTTHPSSVIIIPSSPPIRVPSTTSTSTTAASSSSSLANPGTNTGASTRPRPIAQLPARSYLPANPSIQPQSQSRTQTQTRKSHDEPSSDFDFGPDDMDMMDEAVFEELDLIEVEASAGASKALPPAPGRSQARNNSGNGSGSGPSTNVNTRRNRDPESDEDSDVIVIDDEEEDKENAPVPTRHVRRRTAMDVINISDDDDG